MLDPDLEIRGGPGLQKKIFGPQFGLKIRDGGTGPPRAPPLDPPLIYLPSPSSTRL